MLGWGLGGPEPSRVCYSTDMNEGSNSRKEQPPRKALSNFKHNKVLNTSQPTMGHLRESTSNEVTNIKQK